MSNEVSAMSGAPESNVKDGKRWGYAKKNGVFFNGYREQNINGKIIRHAMRGKLNKVVDQAAE